MAWTADGKRYIVVLEKKQMKAYPAADRTSETIARLFILLD